MAKLGPVPVASKRKRCPKSTPKPRPKPKGK